MVFHKYKLIFIGIPKNASHAPYVVLKNKTDVHHDHSSIELTYEEHDKELLDTYTSFAIVRNPYSRAYSAWNYLTLLEDLPNRFGINSFQEYVYALESKTAYFEEMGEELTEHELTFPQYKFICMCNKVLVDHVLRLENLDEEWRNFASNYNKTSQFKIQTQLKIRNSMEYKEPDWKKAYTPEMYKIINEFYKKDFELFGYKIIKNNG
jgi:chondroitin 4-sulfotransferase 11